MKDFLKKMIARKKKQAEALRAKSQASDSIEEVRSIGEQLSALTDEIRDAEAQLAEIEAAEAAEVDGEEGEEGEGEERSAVVPAGKLSPMATYGSLSSSEERSDSPTDSMEYRQAFREFVMHGTPIPAELRDDQNTTTTDVSAVIPTVLVNQIIEKAESIGMILPLVTKTSYPAGVEIPVASMKPVATWVAEGASSDRQKFTTSGKVTFTHHKLRCEVSISKEVDAMALSAFEAKLVTAVANAMVKAKEQAIIDGDGSGKPKGILKETPDEGQAIALTSGTKLSYALLCEAEGAIPEAYEATTKWFMSKKTFMSFIGMTDEQGQPVARVNYGIGGKPERTLLGREVVLTGTYLPNYEATPDAPKTFAFLFDMSDYVMNSIYDMGITKKQDWDTEDMLTKAVTSCDGKVVDKTSLVTLTINNA